MRSGALTWGILLVPAAAFLHAPWPLAQVRHRTGQCRLRLGLGEWLGKWLGDDTEYLEGLRGVVGPLLREEGWTLRCEIGSTPARLAGGTGKLARSDSPTRVVSVPVALKMAERYEEGYDIPNGDARVLKSSRIFGTGGIWSAAADEKDGPDGLPKFLELRLKCPDGLMADDAELLPSGEVYFSSRLIQTESGTVQLTNGLVTVKEVNDPLGIYAELKIVGSFEASAREADSSLSPSASPVSDRKTGSTA